MMSGSLDEVWARALARDDAWVAQDRDDNDEELNFAPQFLRCIFCGRQPEPTDAMLAWWEREVDDHHEIVACGIYCRRERCGSQADAYPEQLLDVHAHHAVGCDAWVQLNRLVFAFDHWSGSALQRMVRIIGEMSRLPSAQDQKNEIVRHGFGHLNAVPKCAGIYFVQTTASSDGPVKIGTAADIQDRLRGLQTAHPWPLRLLRHEAIGLDDDRRSRERELHQRFASLRLHGEWFKFDASLLEES